MCLGTASACPKIQIWGKIENNKNQVLGSHSYQLGWAIYLRFHDAHCAFWGLLFVHKHHPVSVRWPPQSICQIFGFVGFLLTINIFANQALPKGCLLTSAIMEAYSVHCNLSTSAKQCKQCIQIHMRTYIHIYRHIYIYIHPVYIYILYIYIQENRETGRFWVSRKI